MGFFLGGRMFTKIMKTSKIERLRVYCVVVVLVENGTINYSPIKMASLRSKTKTKRYFITNWLPLVANSSSGINNRIFKNSFCFELYLVSLPTKQRNFFMQIRTRNHRLPIETGRWQKIQREERLCNLCKSEIGEEFHNVVVCQNLENVRRQHLNRHFMFDQTL